MKHSALIWVISLQKRCMLNDMSLLSYFIEYNREGEVLLKNFMLQRRLLSYEYFTQKTFLQGCIQCQKFDFFIGPKDMVTPVYLELLTNVCILQSSSIQIQARVYAEYYYYASLSSNRISIPEILHEKINIDFY